MKFALYAVEYKGRVVLEGLLNAGYIPEYVKTYRDKNLNNSEFDNIIDICDKYNIPLYGRNDIVDLHADKIFVIGWQYLIKENLEKYIVFHDSCLPQYSGWCPIVNSLIDGMPYIGATAFAPTLIIDQGLVYDRRKIFISYPITIKEATDKVMDLYISMIKDIISKKVVAQQISYEEKTTSMWLDITDYFIDWNCTVGNIERFVNAIGPPFDGAKTLYNGKIITIVSAERAQHSKVENVSRHVGKVVAIEDNCPIVVCKDGFLKINKALDGRNDVVFNKIRSRFGNVK